MRMAIPADAREPDEHDGRAATDAAVARAPREGTPSGNPYAELLQSIYDAVLITCEDGTVLECNARALDMLRLQADELRGQFVMTLVSGADGGVWSAIRQNLDDQRYTLMEARVRRGDQSLFPAEIAVNRMCLEAGTRLCFFVRDITIRKQAQEALEDAVARLEEHDHSRMQFVSNVSHELRTPLTSMIYAIANMLLGVVGPISDNVRKYLDMLDGDCKRLLATVNDILDLRNIEDQTLTLSRNKVPFGRLVARGIESLMIQSEHKSIAMTIDTGPTGLFVDCDPVKMQRVVLNVVGNAVKFTPEDGEVGVRVDVDGAMGRFVRLTVTDTGIGIPPEALARVTERYFTVGEQPSGSGLGLAITKEIVALHGGGIAVQSPVPGQPGGTLVAVSLPRVEPPTVLVVDDEPAIRELLARELTGAGYRAITAQGGTEALSLIRANPPAAVVVDLELPDMPGTELILQTKSDEALRKIPLIAVTGAGIDKAKEQIMKSFAIPLLTKPWQEKQLIRTLEDVFFSGSAGG